MGDSAREPRPDLMGGRDRSDENADVMGGPGPVEEGPAEEGTDVMGGPGRDEADVMRGPGAGPDDGDVMDGEKRSTDVMGQEGSGT